MIWVVLDSNVYISALVFGGVPRVVLESAEDGLFWLAVSDPIKKEVQSVLRRKFGWPETRVNTSCQVIWDYTELVTPTIAVTVLEDPADNRVLECALDARASVVVTGDAGILRLKQFHGIALLTPRAFLDSALWHR